MIKKSKNKTSGRKGPMLSFADEDEENEEEFFQMKKSKESKKFKKMKQAPDINNNNFSSYGLSSSSLTTEGAVSSSSSSSSAAGVYTKEYLQNLRNEQNYVPSHAVDVNSSSNNETNEADFSHPMEVELTGEAAEEFVNMTERLNASGGHDRFNRKGDRKVKFSSISDTEQLEKEKIIKEEFADAKYRSKLSSKKSHNTIGDNTDRVYTSDLLAHELNKEFDGIARDKEGQEWETDLINRGAFSAKPVSVSTSATSGFSNTTTFAVNSALPALDIEYGDDATFDDLLTGVNRAIIKLQESTENCRRRIEQLKVEQTSVVLPLFEKNKKALEEKIARVNVANSMKTYFATVVGMLREKSSDIGK